MDLSDCGCAEDLLQQANRLQAACVSACVACGMQVVGERFHQFEPAGVTGAVLLAESHLTIHTWPEIRFVALDVYVCDHTESNHSKGEALTAALQQLFAARACHARCLPRATVKAATAVAT